MAEPDGIRTLTPEEIRHFKREGYVICYGLLSEQLMSQCRQRLWEDAPASLRADDPESWVGPIATADETGSGMHGIAANSRAGYIWKERVAGGEQLMLDLLPETLAPIAEQLLGKGEVHPATGEDVGTMLGLQDDENLAAELKRIADSSDVGIGPLCARFLSLIDTDDFPVPLPSGAKLREMFVVGTRARGIYATLPQPLGSERPFLTGGGHNDGHPFQLGVEAYIDDVPIAKDTKPVDCYGPAGTCIFWHHRGMHAAGPNFSDRLRLAVLYEWARTQIDDGPPPVDDMWRDWSEAVRAVGPEYGAITDDANRTGLPAAEIGTHEARKHRHDQATDRGAARL